MCPSSVRDRPAAARRGCRACEEQERCLAKDEGPQPPGRSPPFSAPVPCVPRARKQGRRPRPPIPRSRRSSPRPSRRTRTCWRSARRSSRVAPRPAQAGALPGPDGLGALHERRLEPEPRRARYDDARVHGQPDAALARQAFAAREDRGAATRPAAERLERQRRLSVAAGVRRAFWSLLLSQESLGVLREQQEVWKEAEGVARARYAVGQGAQQDVLRAQLEITRFEQLRAQQEAESEAPRGRALASRRPRGGAGGRRGRPSGAAA